MVDHYYMGGGTPQASGDAKLFLAEFLGGFPEGTTFVDITDGGYITKGDPYFRFSEAGGDKVLDIGLWNDYRIQISDASGIRGWNENSSEWVDLLTGGALQEEPPQDHSTSGMTIVRKAGESLVYGNFCYYKNDGKMYKAKADAEATMPCVAMARETISADASGSFLTHGTARDDSWSWASGDKLVVSDNTAGALLASNPSDVGDQVQRVGWAISKTSIMFKADLAVVEVGA